ncbi:hypothetical protein YC2023_110578 [Brassica napus]
MLTKAIKKLQKEIGKETRHHGRSGTSVSGWENSKTTPATPDLEKPPPYALGIEEERGARVITRHLKAP